MSDVDSVAAADAAKQPVRIWLSPPHLERADHEAVEEALRSNWVAPVGPDLARFEAMLTSEIGVPYGVAVASGTAALHLALLVIGVGPGDSVLVSDLTFVASANPIRYVGATPVFVDCEASTWNLDPSLVEEHLIRAARTGDLPRALVAVDLYGQVCRFDALRPVCERFGVTIVEDAAESLGATYQGHAAGSFGDVGIFSFNGNKVITTSGGGMLVSSREDWVARARHLATQAREPLPYYEHTQVGYNYRLSNVLAALGCSQLSRLGQMVARRRAIHERYRSGLADVPGVGFMPAHPDGEPSWWLSCITIDADVHPNGRDKVMARLSDARIEARPVWKPMHLQPVFRDCQLLGGSVSVRLFDEGLCLPSGSALTNTQVDEVLDICLESLSY